MDLALPELLSREDILNIFVQRQLHINNMHELNNDELLRIYKTFVMPLTKRHERNKHIKQNHSVSKNKNDDHEDRCMLVETLEDVCSAMEIDCICVEKYNVDRIDSPVGEKRRQRSSDDDMFETDYQYQLSSQTKRIRINSFS